MLSAMSQLLLIRHGQASFGAADYDRLSPVGERQARVTGRHLAALRHEFDVIVSGDLVRQRRTADLAGQAGDEAPGRVIDPAFNEYDPQPLFHAYLPRVMEEQPEMAAIRQETLFSDRRRFQRVFEAVTRHWIAGTAHALDSFETWAEFTARVTAGLARLHDDYGRDARIGLFSSGGPIAAAVAVSMGASAQHTLQLSWSIYNTAISEMRSTRTGWRLIGFNDITHLRLTGDAALVTFR